jgi:hypothetical protein
MTPAFKLILLVLISVGLSSLKAADKFSTLFEGAFNPEADLRKNGFAVQSAPDTTGTRNAPHGYAWRSWQGTMTTKTTNACETAAKVIRDALNKAIGSQALDELTGPRNNRSKDQPLTGMLRYNKDRMHGDLWVWLIPGGSETNISYVLHLREEPLKR